VKGYTITYKVKKAALSKDSSCNKYKGSDANLEEVLDGLKKLADWTLQFEVTPPKAKAKLDVRANGFGYLEINKHPGHTHGKGWKYKIEGGKDANRSVDRLIVSGTEAELEFGEPDGKAIAVTASLSCSVKVAEDTH
jgi:hypothetical protein